MMDATEHDLIHRLPIRADLNDGQKLTVFDWLCEVIASPQHAVNCSPECFCWELRRKVLEVKFLR